MLNRYKCGKCKLDLCDSIWAEAVDSPCHKRCKKCGREIFISEVEHPETIETVHFELIWDEHEPYFPQVEPFISWMNSDPDPYSGMELGVVFIKEYWCYLNHLCVVTQALNEHQLNFCVTATKRWVTKKCPCLLTTHKQFVVQPNKDGEYIGKFGNKFFEWHPDNWGIYFISWIDKLTYDARNIAQKKLLGNFNSPD